MKYLSREFIGAASANHIQISKKTSYLLLGIFLAAGAPVGWALLSTAEHDFRASTLLYVYMTVSTAVMFGLFGFALGIKQERIEALAEKDFLTGLLNQKTFFRVAGLLLSVGHRYGHPVSIIMMDIDKFKSLVDSQGHLAGNSVLKQLGVLLEAQTRKSDAACRFGGDEFVLCLSGATKEQAAQHAERIRSQIESTKFHFEGKDHCITMSLGVAESGGGNDEAIMQVVEAADRALFNAKAGGRNRVAIAQ